MGTIAAGIPGLRKSISIDEQIDFLTSKQAVSLGDVRE